MLNYFPQQDLAQVVKFFTVSPQGGRPAIRVFRLRPGHANAEAEFETDEVVMKVLKEKMGLHGIVVVGFYVDCTGRETRYVQHCMKGWLRGKCKRTEAEIENLERHPDRFLVSRGHVAGLDIRHLLKNLRNACCFGSTSAPSSGNYHVMF